MANEKYNQINKENAYEILKEFAKEYKKYNGKQPIEIVIVGGGSIVLNYGFRTMTQDFDISIPKTANIKDAISHVTDKFNLNPDWMNTDFKSTKSYSPRLPIYSKHYCSFNNGTVEFRTINDEYLIAMKMMSLRGYRNDFSDIIGILEENAKAGTRIEFPTIETAIRNLYGESSLSGMKPAILERVKVLCESSIEELHNKFESEKTLENTISDKVSNVNEKYQGVITEDNIDDVVSAMRSSMENRKLIVLCGVPGSGKTEYAARLKQQNPNIEIISLSNEIRNIGNRNIPMALNSVYYQIQELLNSGRDVVYDAANLKLEHRNAIVDVLNDPKVTKELHVLDVSKETALANCAKRHVSITKERLCQLIDDLNNENPTLDDGWNKISLIKVPEVELTPEIMELINERIDESNHEDLLSDVITEYDCIDLVE